MGFAHPTLQINFLTLGERSDSQLHKAVDVEPPYGAWRASQAWGKRPKGAARKDAGGSDARQDAASAERGAPSREAQAMSAPSGACFFGVLFFARAKKSTSPAVREPQVKLVIDDCANAHSNRKQIKTPLTLSLSLREREPI